MSEPPATPRCAWAAAQDASAHAFVDALDDRIELGGPVGHHLQRVRRLRTGERVTAADGVGGWRLYEVEDVARGRLVLGERGPRSVEPQLVPGVALLVAPVKAGALDTVVARCTELGVARVTPVRTRRCVVQWDVEQSVRVVERLRTIAREAAAQCRRARIPSIGPVSDLGAFVGFAGLVVADRAGSRVSELAEPVDESGAVPAWTVLVGPEGGLDPDEVAQLGDVPRLALGPHVLRAVTAPLAATAVLVGRSRELCPK